MRTSDAWLFDVAGQRWLTRLTVVLGPVFALLFLTGFVGLHRQGEVWASILIPVAAVPVSVAVATYVRWLARPRRVIATNGTVGGRLGTVVPVMRRSLLYLALPFTALLIVAVWGFVVSLANGSSPWPWGVGGVLVGVFLPQVYRSIARRPVLALTSDGVTYRGQTIDARLGWDDITGVGLRAGPRGQVLTVVGRAGAASWALRRTFWIFALEWKPTDEYIDVEIHGSGDRELAVVLPAWVELYRQTPALRSELGTPAAVQVVEELCEREIRRRGGRPG